MKKLESMLVKKFKGKKKIEILNWLNPENNVNLINSQLTF